MKKNIWLRVKTGHLRAIQAQKGQSIIIVTFAFIGLLAMLGLALDLGLVYIEQIKVSRTADAAALAGVVELPFEEQAMQRAIEYIELNGYQVGVDTAVLVRGCVNTDEGLLNVDASGKLDPEDLVPGSAADAVDGYTYFPAAGEQIATFIIDTMSYQSVDYNDSTGAIKTKNEEMCNADQDLYGTANKMRVTGRVMVNMNFMQFFGFGEVPVHDEAIGENVTNLDVVVVFDRSGSMNFETNCFGCWERSTSSSRKYDPYPSNGDFNPLFYNVGGTFNTWEHPVCTALPASTSANGFKYMAHEAEFYSADVPLHGWEFDKRNPGQGFWVLQRTGKGSNAAYIRPHPYSVYSQSNTSEYPQLQGAAYNIECFDGPDLSYQCWKAKADSLGETAPGNVPWVEYDFTPDWTGSTSIWIRAVGAGSYGWAWNGVSPTSHSNWRNAIYWQVDGNDVAGGPFPNIKDGAYTQPSSNSDWRWIKIASEVPTGTAGTRHVLKLYQGSAGFNLDKIVFTNNHEGSVGMAIPVTGNVIGGSVTYMDNVLQANSGTGPAATNGSATREACNKCNPAFGQTVNKADCSCKKDKNDTSVGLFPAGGSGEGCSIVEEETNHLMNDLFHGEEDPIRSAKEAVKNFAKRLDPKFDQIGVVPFSANTATDSNTRRVKLQCLRFAGAKYSGTDGQRKCWDEGTDPISYTLVINALEDYQPSGNTNISEAMREGLEELGVDTPTNDATVNSNCDPNQTNDAESCDRRGAARRVLILMTDGSPNQYASCPSSYNWNGYFGAGTNDYDCAMYFAEQAAANNVVVYTIGIGSGVNIDLMTAMATGTDPGKGDVYFESRGGRYYPAARPSDLDAIFEDILSNVFVRIIG